MSRPHHDPVIMEIALGRGVPGRRWGNARAEKGKRKGFRQRPSETRPAQPSDPPEPMPPRPTKPTLESAMALQIREIKTTGV